MHPDAPHPGRWLTFRSEHPWWEPLVHAPHIPSVALALPAPLGFKLALALAIVGMTVGNAALRWVAWNAHVKEWIQGELRAPREQ